MCGQSEQALFAHFFMYLLGGASQKQTQFEVISYRGFSPLQKQFFSMPGQGVNMNLLQGGEGLTRHIF
jgi:hypothetical protein